MRILELTTIESRQLRKEGAITKVKDGVTYSLLWDASKRECVIASTESVALSVYNPRTAGDSIRLTFEESKQLEKSEEGYIMIERSGYLYKVTNDNKAFVQDVCDIVLVRK